MVMRISEKVHESRVRRSALKVDIAKAILTATQKDDGLTMEEIVLVLGETIVDQQAIILRELLKGN